VQEKASQQREDKVVALEIIISTAIQINPLVQSVDKQQSSPRALAEQQAP